MNIYFLKNPDWGLIKPLFYDNYTIKIIEYLTPTQASSLIGQNMLEYKTVR